MKQMGLLKRWGVAAAFVLFGAGLAAGCRQSSDSQEAGAAHPGVMVSNPVTSRASGRTSSSAPTGAADNMALGNPSNATADQRTASNYLLERPQYTLSYNKNQGGPNWVSWHVQQSDLGRVPRSNSFAPDPLLPPDWQVRPTDYIGSGYDRGHQCPSGDRTANKEDNNATFYMSNMLPQAGDLNRHVWEKLESYCRDRVKGGNELYIVAGGYGAKDRIRGKITIPTNCWKVIVELPQGDNDLARINASTRVIAVDMPNEEGIASNRWQQYITTASAIEQKTGYHFFTNLTPIIQDALKTKKDAGRASSSDDTRSSDTRSQRRSEAPHTSRSTDAATRYYPQPIPARRSTRVPSIQSPTAPDVTAGSAPQVWVNTKSGVYHYPGQRWYGKTVEGQYMSETQAIQQGYRPNHNGQ